MVQSRSSGEYAQIGRYPPVSAQPAGTNGQKARSKALPVFEQFWVELTEQQPGRAANGDLCVSYYINLAATARSDPRSFEINYCTRHRTSSCWSSTNCTCQSCSDQCRRGKRCASSIFLSTEINLRICLFIFFLKIIDELFFPSFSIARIVVGKGLVHGLTGS